MKALTLWRPWPWAIFHAPPGIAKRIENRPWKPWASIVGQTIALHAGRHWDAEAAGFILQTVFPGETPPKSNPIGWTDQGIIGTARVVGCINAKPWSTPQDLWWSGPFAWQLDEVRVLPVPIACRGAQGLWPVPNDIESRIRSMLPIIVPESGLVSRPGGID